VPERLPLKQFHRDESSPVDLIDFVDCADVRVVQSGGRLCLTPESFKRLRVSPNSGGKNFSATSR
jgi:hypothetical protein